MSSLLRILGLPVLETVEGIASAMRISGALLYRLSKQPKRFYRFYSINKRSGGTREIAQPNRTAKAVQLWILRNILDQLKVSSASKGFQRGESILTNVIPHSRANAVLQLDLENFFPSISADRAYHIFKSIGYPPSVAALLTSLCTVDGKLPQGAPTSPKLANLVCLPLDARLLGFVGKRGIVYTRYADDLTFSASNARTLANAEGFIRHIIR